MLSTYTAVEIEAMRAYLEQHLPEYLETLRAWIGVNSFTLNAPGVNQLGRLTAERFASLGFIPEFIPSTNSQFGRHVVLTRTGRSQRTIGLVSHLDTVFPPADEIQNDFRWRVEGDRLYGPGTVDIKGGTVAIYMLLDVVQRFAPQAFDDITWIILLDASEEVDGEDFGALCQARLGRDTLACLIFEGGAFDGREFLVVTARKGMSIYRVMTEGKASHAGTSHGEGASAIVQMADVVQRIASFTDYERHITFNVGTLAGGTVTNRVAHFASATVEMRAFDNTVYAEGQARMAALNQLSTVKSPNNGYACRVQVEVVREMPPWPSNPATEGLYAVWEEAAGRLGYTVRRQARGGLSDGNYLWARVPTLDGLGPAGDNAHCSERSADGSKDQEYTVRSSFVPKTLLNALAVLQLIE